MTTMRRTLTMIAAALAAGALAAGCGTEEDHVPAASAPVAGTAVAVTDTTMADAFEATGVAEPIQRAMVGTKLMARVTGVLVREGDRVAAGQVLVRLDARDITAKGTQVQAGVAAAEAMQQEALAQATRIRALYADSAAPKAQLDAAEAGLARAEAAVRQARAAGAELDAVGDYAILRAPFAGVVTQRMVDVGAFAAPGQPLVVVEDQSSLRISVSAAPDAVAGVHRGQVLAGTVAGRAVTATVEGIASAPGGHMVTVNAVVANRDDASFGGSAATLALPAGSRRVIMVPTAALVREGDLVGVRVKTAAGADLRWIHTGRERADQVEVLSGLSAGDQVIVPSGTGEGK